MRNSRNVRLLVPVLVGIVLIAVFVSSRVAPAPPSSPVAPASTSSPVAPAPPAAAVAAGLPATWQTIEYCGARLTVPGDWIRLRTSDCDHPAGFWMAPGEDARWPNAFVSFHDPTVVDNFDPPGLARSAGGRWGGHAYAGRVGIDIAGPTRDQVQRMLDSVTGT
jgi:hypothetical protein